MIIDVCLHRTNSNVWYVNNNVNVRVRLFQMEFGGGNHSVVLVVLGGSGREFDSPRRPKECWLIKKSEE